MTQIRLYIDEDAIQHSLIEALRNSSVDVMTTLESNRLSCPDKDQLIWAREQGRVIYSFNRQDFSRLHSQFLLENKHHAGIILAQQQRYSIGEQLRGLLNLITTKSAADMVNQLEYLSVYIRKLSDEKNS